MTQTITRTSQSSFGWINIHPPSQYSAQPAIAAVPVVSLFWFVSTNFVHVEKFVSILLCKIGQALSDVNL